MALQFVGERKFVGGLAVYKEGNLSDVRHHLYSAGDKMVTAALSSDNQNNDEGEYEFQLNMDGPLVEAALQSEPLAIQYANQESIIWSQVKGTILANVEKMHPEVRKETYTKTLKNTPW